jgi:sec-independent protein translocase protein TatA
MLGNAFTGWHLIVVLAIILLLFGAPKLPGLAKSIAQSMRIFKNEVNSDKRETSDDYDDRAGRRSDSATSRPTDDHLGRAVDDSYPPSTRDVPPKS